ncbi:MAG: alpha/beta fold hydrolase [Deltaproteobacteria bacterium]|nr:alpha/beta fold hydrolase [Deltaproteobacteria bacterium]MBI2530672.1 alpha/beta fold hydrolase [Deltaproteobacteria bacterium]MBI3063872.1 alpha/beta fold hydrolase [Deltaproteobacteria bacterium]
MPSANLHDIQIYYEERGEGETILLAPPSWWPCDTWNVAVVPALSQRYRTIVFDCRGTGYSSKPDHGYTIRQFAEDCAGLLEHLKISRCHAVGFALGGQIVQALAIERPDLVATVTIAAAGAGVKALDGGPRQARTTDEEEIRKHGFERFIRGHIENDDMAFNPKFFRERPEGVRALSDALWQRQTSPEQHRYHYEARQTWDTLGNAARIMVPTLVLCGAADDVNRGGSTPVGTARRLAELVPGCELALIPNVKHMTFWDGNGALAALDEFLRRHPIHGI